MEHGTTLKEEISFELTASCWKEQLESGLSEVWLVGNGGDGVKPAGCAKLRAMIVNNYFLVLRISYLCPNRALNYAKLKK